MDTFKMRGGGARAGAGAGVPAHVVGAVKVDAGARQRVLGALLLALLGVLIGLLEREPDAAHVAERRRVQVHALLVRQLRAPKRSSTEREVSLRSAVS